MRGKSKEKEKQLINNISIEKMDLLQLKMVNTPSIKEMIKNTLSSFLALCLVPAVLVPQMCFIPARPPMPDTNEIINIVTNWSRTSNNVRLSVLRKWKTIDVYKNLLDFWSSGAVTPYALVLVRIEIKCVAVNSRYLSIFTRYSIRIDFEGFRALWRYVFEKFTGTNKI